MIPEPLSIVPLVVLLGAAILVLLYVGIKTGAASLKTNGTSATRKLSMLMTAVSAVLCVASGVLLLSILSTHGAAYDSLVWKSLEANYGISASVDQQGFSAATPFSAIVNGEPASCTATPPATVVCNGQSVPPSNTQAPLP